MWNEYINAINLEEVLQVLAEKGSRARVVAGATDLILELERAAGSDRPRQGIETLVDISRIPALDCITLGEDDPVPTDIIHLGPLVTHNHCVASKLICEHAYPLARAAWEVGSPQIRNRGTVAGNLITASPANDTITPLMALGASVTLRSLRGERVVALKDFYTGVRKTVMAVDEILVDIAFPALRSNQRGTYIKFALRRAQAISLVNAAVVLTIDPVPTGIVQSAAITLGAVAPTIVHAALAQDYLVGKRLEESVIHETARLAQGAAHPISDVRSSAGYRSRMVGVTVARALRAIADGSERAGFPQNPVLLSGSDRRAERKRLRNQAGCDGSVHQAAAQSDQPPVPTGSVPTDIVTMINGQEYSLKGGQHQTLLHLLREVAGLTGSKEGCAEGECGACTVFLDGMAVMSCLVPAPRAHGAQIVTVEGLSQDGKLHPVQEAFIQEGAVQCGYCTPGFLMSAVKLLEERPNPDQDAIRQALTGNLCRCTGYYKIIQAVEKAAKNSIINE